MGTFCQILQRAASDYRTLISSGLFLALFIDMSKANNKYIKDYDKDKESSYLHRWDISKLYGWAMSQKLPINNFEWIKDTSQFNEGFIKKLWWRMWWRAFSSSWCSILEKLHELHNDLPFLPKYWSKKKSKKWFWERFFLSWCSFRKNYRKCEKTWRY